MKALLAGYGSIGRRRAKALAALTPCDLVILEPRQDRGNLAVSELPHSRHALTLDEALLLEKTYDLSLVTTPTHLHLALSMALLDHTLALFVEKPLSHDMAGVKDLLEKTSQMEMVTMVACNMRFHPVLKRLAEMVHDGLVGRPLYGRLRFGQDLASWRPASDYRGFYSAHREQGGGIILDDIHEIDLASYIFGPIAGFKLSAGKLGDLELDVEDFASINLSTASGAMVNVTMDYLHPLYQRQVEVVGVQGALRWDEDENILWRADRGHPGWSQVLQLENYDYNEIYVEEMKHLLECIKTGRPTMNPISHAAELTEMVLAMRAEALTAVDHG